MSLSSSLNAGVAGLAANSSRLSVISDNISNSSTNGYRRADIEFSSLVVSEGAGTYTAGGVRTTALREVDRPGALTTSHSSTDIAVTGKGFLPVTPIGTVSQPASERPFQLVATGSFRRNEDGYLVTPSGLALTGWPTDANGSLLGTVTRDGPTSLVPVRLSAFLTESESTTLIELGVNLPARETEAGASGTPISSPVEYFDAIGSAYQLNIVFTPTVPAAGRSNQWRVEFFDEAQGGASVGALDLVFDGTRGNPGELISATPVGGSPVTYDPATGQATINVLDGPIELQLQSNTARRGMTQLNAAFTPDGLSKNGAPAGSLTTVEIDEDGFLVGVYDSGQRQVLYQIPLAAVPNPNGLEALSNQAFQISPSSGEVFLFDANTGPVDGVAGFALQQSAVDIAQELTDMIVTQRAYSSNATVIRTVDEMLQETTNLKR